MFSFTWVLVAKDEQVVIEEHPAYCAANVPHAVVLVDVCLRTRNDLSAIEDPESERDRQGASTTPQEVLRRGACKLAEGECDLAAHVGADEGHGGQECDRRRENDFGGFSIEHRKVFVLSQLTFLLLFQLVH